MPTDYRCRRSIFIVLFQLVATVSSRSILRGEHVVHTPLGTIRGIGQSIDDAKVSAFLGVPYAKPPIGSRRFRMAEMIDRWSGELEAKNLAKTCYLTADNTFPQFPGAEMWNPPGAISEDCLNMNIWVPENHDGSVMVWIYGGGFFSGTPSLDLYSGTVLAAKENTIVVNVNYRLGPFGFLYFGDDSPIQGNMGLMDQQLALKWIHQNIGAFGGDPTRMSMFAESAGSASATAHLFAPNSFNYYQNIIAMSGSIINSWATAKPQTLLERSMKLAKRVNCSSVDQKAIAKCLSNVPAHLIQQEADNISGDIGPPMTFAFVPVSADVNFFQGDVFEKLQKKQFKKDVNIVFGSVKDEGTYWLPYYMAMPRYGFAFNHTISAEDPHNRALITKQHYAESMKAFMPYFGSSSLVLNAFMNSYEQVSHSRVPEERYRDGVARFLGDLFFTCSLIEFADMISDNIFGNVYMYYFTYRSSANPWPKWMGVMHGYEIEYGFGQPFWRPHLYDQGELHNEKKLSAIIMDLWANFANTGEMENFWPRYNKIERKALVLGEGTLHGRHSIIRDVHGQYCRMIDEAKTFVAQKTGADCRSTRRLEVVSAAVLDTSSSAMNEIGKLLLIPLFTLLISSIVVMCCSKSSKNITEDNKINLQENINNCENQNPNNRAQPGTAHKFEANQRSNANVEKTQEADLKSNAKTVQLVKATSKTGLDKSKEKIQTLHAKSVDKSKEPICEKEVSARSPRKSCIHWSGKIQRKPISMADETQSSHEDTPTK
ncbi:unnamed protein product [Caenorhabditis bovis]|uniref:acetylcholinesterase n=1 Tax=Caenorhabditis bovis TaxID=2654633 RepID=A0A8S1F3I1_9PELO|nr:unnamed protein product [Caenorhabditis bovis]